MRENVDAIVGIFVPTLMESIIENNDDCEALIVQNYSNFEERITAGKIIVWS